jgi:hypothetical protein
MSGRTLRSTDYPARRDIGSDRITHPTNEPCGHWVRTGELFEMPGARTASGRERAKAQGVRLGRKPKLTATRRQYAARSLPCCRLSESARTADLDLEHAGKLDHAAKEKLR